MYRKANKGIIILHIGVMLTIPLLLTGCWNNRDIAEINIVTGLGLDRTEDGKVLLTTQVAKPAAIQSTSSGKKKGGGDQSKPVFVESYEGETVFETLRGMLSVAENKLFASTARILILGERLAQDGIEDVLDFFLRDQEIDYSMVVLVAKGATPREILEMETDKDSISAVYIENTVENTISRGTVKKTMLIDLAKDMGSSGKQSAIGQVSKTEEKEIKTEGTAVFKDGRLVGSLNSYETRGYLFAINKVKSAIINVSEDKGKASMEIIRSKGTVKVAFEKGEPCALIINVNTEAYIGEYKGKGTLHSPDNLSVLEQLLEEEIKKEIKSALEKTQKKYSSDIFGFGTYVRKYHPQYWKNTKKDWNDIFSSLPANIEVDAKILRTGNIKSSVKKE